ncbi:MAG TPA: amino acid adenylation domain-containing protein [Pyrinomonadaceae bacterium]|nr:amino acid adenylation domain-containing protein [Pyrinomonadaceae bacterium]
MNDLSRRIAELSPAKLALLAQKLKAASADRPKLRIPRRSVAGSAAPLTFAQQRLWFLAQLEPGSTAYNMNLAVRVTGPLDLEALEQSLNEVVRRHEALRTSFAASDGKPIQVIAPELHVTLRVVDNTTVAEDLQDAEIERRAIEQARQPFDLSEAPLFRMSLVRLAEAEHVVLFTIHHIISDIWSLSLLTLEMAKLYEAFRDNNSSPLPLLPIQYADFAVWQREQLQGDFLEAELNYWRQQLAGAPFVLDLPTDRPRLVVPNLRGATESFQLDEALTEALIQLSKRENVTLFMTLLAAFQTLLYRYTRQQDILVGTPIAGRDRIETEKLIGFFADTLVLRTRISGDPTFLELLGRVREVALGAYSHQDLPFEKLVEALQPERDLARNPIFQVLFALHNTPVQTLQLPGLVWTPLKLNIPKARFDLALDLSETASGIAGACQYNADLFDAATITGLLSHYRTLLESIVVNPKERVSHLPLLTDSERRKMLLEWNSPPRKHPNDLCLHELFERQAELNPGATAVVYENVRLTYEELNRRANQLAHYLRANGVGPEVLVGISIERGVEMLIGLLGILKAGGAYVPLDPAYPKDRLDFMLRDAGVPLLLTMKHLRRLLPENDEVRTICLDEDWPEVGHESEENPQIQMSSRNLAYVIYTSGSTGRPKGVQVEHESVVSLFAATQPWFDFSVNDTWTVSHSYAFDFSVWEIWGCLLHGGRLVIVPLNVNQSPDAFRELLRSEKVTILNQTPSAIRQLFPGDAEDLALRLIICGGEALPREVADQLADLGVPAWNFYGPTEATVWAAINKITTGPVSIGRPLANTQVYVLDSNLELLPVNVAGELFIGGAGVARGYYQRSELTAERFVPDAYSGTVGGRLYRTGDRVRYAADGKLEFLGRVDEQVKVRGYRIELGEIESVLGEAAGVQQAVAIVRESESWVDQRLLAYVVLENGADADVVKRLRGHLSQKLPEYMMPTAIVVLAELPLSANGKVDRRALPEPGAMRSDLAATDLTPRSPTQELLASRWSHLLRVEPVGIHDNFFELGGHSLLATQVVSWIRETFSVEVPLRSLFEHPTVAGLAEIIDSEMRASHKLQSPPLRPVSRDQALPLSYAQQRLWFSVQLEPNNPVYNISAAVRLKGHLNIAALEKTLNEIVRRHEVLRTTFPVVGQQLVQVIVPDLTMTLPIDDLSVLPDEEREVEAQLRAREESECLFDLSHGPVLRVKLLRLSEVEHIALLTMHHIVSDRWSMNLLITEVSALYRAFSANQPSPLPELPLQYADFAVWQREWLSGDVLESQLAYWKRQLLGAPSLFSLPADRPRAMVQGFQSARHSLALSKELSLELKELARREGVTLFIVLVAALQTLLGYCTGERDAIIGTDVANRNRAETEGLIGFFINQLVLRTRLRGEVDFRQLLKEVREVALEAYAHQDVPFEKVVEAIKPDRTQKHAPLFQVKLNLHYPDTGRLELPELELSPLTTANEALDLDLMFVLTETAAGLSGSIRYKSELFDAGRIIRLKTHFEFLLKTIAQSPLITINELWQSLAEMDQTEQRSRHIEREELKLKRFKNIKPIPVSLTHADS